MCDNCVLMLEQYKHGVKHVYLHIRTIRDTSLKYPRCVFTSKVFQSTAQGAAAPSADCRRKQQPADLWTNRNAEWECPANKHVHIKYSICLREKTIQNLNMINLQLYKQRKAADPHILEAGSRQCLLNKLTSDDFINQLSKLLWINSLLID